MVSAGSVSTGVVSAVTGVAVTAVSFLASRCLSLSTICLRPPRRKSRERLAWCLANTIEFQPLRVVVGDMFLGTRDFTGSSVASDSWVTAGDRRPVRAEIKSALQSKGGRLVDTADDGPLNAIFGSRLLYRLIGFLVPPTSVPIHATVTVSTVLEGSRVNVDVSSDEGKYVFRVDILANGSFDRGFMAFFKTLRQVAPPIVGAGFERE